MPIQEATRGAATHVAQAASAEIPTGGPAEVGLTRKSPSRKGICKPCVPVISASTMVPRRNRPTIRVADGKIRETVNVPLDGSLAACWPTPFAPTAPGCATLPTTKSAFRWTFTKSSWPTSTTAAPRPDASRKSLRAIRIRTAFRRWLRAVSPQVSGRLEATASQRAVLSGASCLRPAPTQPSTVSCRQASELCNSRRLASHSWTVIRTANGLFVHSRRRHPLDSGTARRWTAPSARTTCGERSQASRLRRTAAPRSGAWPTSRPTASPN